MPEAISISATIDHIVRIVDRLKKANPVHPVTIISPNASMTKSINRRLLISGKPLLNVRIETFYQHVRRITERDRLNRGLLELDTEQANILLFDIIRQLRLDYFDAAHEFPSYAYYFQRVINELRINIPSGIIVKSLKELGVKGDELSVIYDGYINEKSGFVDYGDILEIYSGTNESLVLFPGLMDDLTFLEKNAIKKNKNIICIDYQPQEISPGITLINPLGSTFEVRDVFRKILDLNVPFDRVAIIAPLDYIPNALKMADRLGIPVYSPMGNDMYPDQAEVFKCVLDVIESDCDYYNLKKLFMLKGQFALISAMIDTGVAVGRELMQRTVNEKINENTTDRLEKLKSVLEKIEGIERLTDSPYTMGEKIIEYFIPKPKKNIFDAILSDLHRLSPDLCYDDFKRMFLERISSLREPGNDSKSSILLTTEYLPGAYDYIFFIGMEETIFPVKFREDPILLDHEREQINRLAENGTLRTAKAKNFRLKEILSMSMACAEKGWFGTFPSMDLASGNPLFPSFHMIDVVKKTTGMGILSPDDYDKNLNQVKIPWILKKPEDSLSDYDWQIYHLMNDTDGFINHILSTKHSALKHFEANRRFMSLTPSEFNGFINMDGRKKQSDCPYFSATELEGFMTCPYRWFIEKQLKIKELQEPVTMKAPDALMKGSILHEVLFLYMSQFHEGTLDRSKIKNILEDVIKNKVEETGSIPSLFVDQLQEEMSEMIDNFLAHEEMYVNGSRTPLYFEFSFGTQHRKNDFDDPVLLNIGKRTFKISGAIDRIDRIDDSVVILDYKGAGASNYKEVNYNGGKSLQPALYAEAFQTLMRDRLGIKIVQSGYLPLRNNSDEYLLHHDDDRKSKLEQIIDFVFLTMEKGFFFTTGDCTYCSYGNLCGRGIEPISALRMEKMKKDKDVGQLVTTYNNFEAY